MFSASRARSLNSDHRGRMQTGASQPSVARRATSAARWCRYSLPSWLSLARRPRPTRTPQVHCRGIVIVRHWGPRNRNVNSIFTRNRYGRDMNILVLDIGGSSVKMWQHLDSEPEKIETGEEFEPDEFLREVQKRLGGNTPDRISIGYPGVVRWGRPAKEAINLGKGWVGFDFAQAFGRPVRIMNDAEMQALGGYAGGRMLYLGLGTGIGTTLITEGGMSQLALGILPFKENKCFEDFLTKEALAAMGLENWRSAVAETATLLKRAVLADYVLIGGGSVDKLDALPEGCRRGGNIDAYFGGLRMWEDIGTRTTMLDRAP